MSACIMEFALTSIIKIASGSPFIKNRLDCCSIFSFVQSKIVLSINSHADGLSFIARTAAEGAGEDEFQADVRFLARLWKKLEQRIKDNSAPSIIYQDLPLFTRAIRDLVKPETEKIRIDSNESYAIVKEFAENFLIDVSDRLEYYPGERPIFDLNNIDDEINDTIR